MNFKCTYVTNVARVFSGPVSKVGWFLSLLRGFFFGFSGIPPSTKINISKFQFDREFEGHRFVIHVTVMYNPRKNNVDLFILFKGITKISKLEGKLDCFT